MGYLRLFVNQISIKQWNCVRGCVYKADQKVDPFHLPSHDQRAQQSKRTSESVDHQADQGSIPQAGAGKSC
jgi:hypothetical protein